MHWLPPGMVVRRFILQVFRLAVYDGECFRFTTSFELVTEIFPDVKVPEKLESGEEVMFLMCRADLHPSKNGSLNHFIPLWKAEKLTESALTKIHQAPEEELLSLKALQESQGQGPAWVAIRETAQTRIDEIERWKQLQEWLWSGGGLIASEVPADGNCAVWSLRACLNSTTEANPEDEDQKLECLKLRQEIAKLWESVKDDVTWRTIFQLLINAFDAPPENEVKQEPHLQTPPKKRKPGPAIFVDLSTPPKDQSQGKHVKAVGGQRPAMQMKRPGDGINPIPPPCPGPADPELPGDDDGDDSKKKRKRPAKAKSKNLKEKLEEAVGGSMPKKSRPQDSGAQADKGAEGDGEENEAEKVKKKQRTCKKKQKTDDERVAETVQTYLSSIGITWLFHQHFHAQQCLGRFGIPKCNKFTDMQAKLQVGKLPECPTCQAMLQSAGFDMDTLKNLMNDIDANCPSPGMTKWKQLRQEIRRVQIQGGEDPGEESMDEKEELPADLQQLSDCTALVPFHDVDMDDEPQKPEPEAEEDIWEIVRKNPFLERLPLNSHDRRVPIRCKVCRSRNQPEGKIFEADVPKKNSVINFVRQHCKRPGHLANLKRWLEDKIKDVETKEDESEMRPCTGFAVCSDKKLKELKAEIVLWARLLKVSAVFGKHKYVFDLSTEDLIVFHSDCQKIIPCPKSDTLPPVCEKCRSSGAGETAAKSAIRFSLKYFGARLLQCRLFKSDEAVAELLDEIKSTNLYRLNPRKFDEIISMKDDELQSSIRQSWLKMRRDTCTAQLLQFIDQSIRAFGIIMHYLTFYRMLCGMSLHAVEECTGEFRHLANQFTAQLVGGGMDELQQLGLRIMKATCTGKLLNHPCIMGIVLQCIDVVNREERGIHSLKKPRQLGDREEGMIQQAGLLLTSNGCSADLMRAMGFSKMSYLRSHSSLDSLLSQGLPCAPLALLKPPVMEQNVALVDQMLPALPGLSSKQRMDGIPALGSFEQEQADFEPSISPLGFEEVFRIIDLVLNYVSEHVRVVICDGEGCNNHIKQVLQGTLPPELRRKMHGFKSLKNIVYKEIDALSSVPGLRPKLCYVNGNLMYGLPAPAHSAKNSSAQLLTESKLLYYGKFFADPSGCLEYSLPLPAYTRKDAAGEDAAWDEAPALHGGLTLAQRCEVAIAGHVCLDLWHLVAESRAKTMFVPWHKIVLAAQTRKNLQGCALGAIAMAASKDACWDPWREPHGLSEVKIEHRLQECANNALDASLKVVSRCSDISVESLETLYREAMEHDGLADEPDEVEDMLLEDVIIADFDNAMPVNEVQTVLSEIQHLAEEEFNECDEENDQCPDAEDQDLKLPDGLQLVDLTKESKSETKALKPETFPHTLSEALSGDRAFWAGLWQLTVSLRCGEDGIDSKFLRKAEVVRRRSRKIGNVVVLNLGHGVKPVPALVLTLWPASKKPRPCIQEVEITRVKCFRGVLLEECEDPEKPCQLVPTDFVWRYIYQQVVAVLDVEQSNLVAGRIIVSQASMDALALVREQAQDEHDAEEGEGQEGSGSKPKTKKRKGKDRAQNFYRIRQRLKKQAEATNKKKACVPLDGEACYRMVDWVEFM
eukprot:s270_g1.t1